MILVPLLKSMQHSYEFAKHSRANCLGSKCCFVLIVTLFATLVQICNFALQNFTGVQLWQTQRTDKENQINKMANSTNCVITLSCCHGVKIILSNFAFGKANSFVVMTLLWETFLQETHHKAQCIYIWYFKKILIFKACGVVSAINI